MNFEVSPGISISNIGNAELRSVYGDMHAHRDAQMMAEHVASLHTHHIIDDAMAAELLKPVVQHRNYTKQYLGTHPDYTGFQPEMTTVATAHRHQKQRDMEMKKFVKDFKAGRIDEDGNPIAQDDVIDAVDSDGHSDDSELTDISELEARLEDPALIQMPTRRRIPSLSAPTAPKPSRKSSVRKQAFRVDRLQPPHDGEDYPQYKYFALLAVCRDRQIFSGIGNTQDVRNRLIQDDINIQQGLPRDTAEWKATTRKGFKHGVPDALKRGTKNDKK